MFFLTSHRAPRAVGISVCKGNFAIQGRFPPFLVVLTILLTGFTPEDVAGVGFENQPDFTSLA